MRYVLIFNRLNTVNIMTQKEEITNIIVKALSELEQIPVELSEKPHTTMMEALRLVKNLDISLVSDSVLNDTFQKGYKAAIDNLNACYKNIFD